MIMTVLFIVILFTVIILFFKPTENIAIKIKYYLITNGNGKIALFIEHNFKCFAVICEICYVKLFNRFWRLYSIMCNSATHILNRRVYFGILNFGIILEHGNFFGFFLS